MIKKDQNNKDIISTNNITPEFHEKKNRTVSREEQVSQELAKLMISFQEEMRMEFDFVQSQPVDYHAILLDGLQKINAAKVPKDLVPWLFLVGITGYKATDTKSMVVRHDTGMGIEEIDVVKVFEALKRQKGPKEQLTATDLTPARFYRACLVTDFIKNAKSLNGNFYRKHVQSDTLLLRDHWMIPDCPKPKMQLIYDAEVMIRDREIANKTEKYADPAALANRMFVMKKFMPKSDK
jgi:hypothetical protein